MTLHGAALLGAALLAACAPVAEPIIAPVPQGTAGETAPRPLLQPVPPTPPEFAQAVQKGTRTNTGQPGPRYWQQRVRYSIDAELDPASTRLTGKERIVYHNNSPDALPYIVINTYQNLFRPATGGLTITRLAAMGQTIPELTPAQTEANRGGVASTTGYFVQGSLGRIYLPHPLAAGDSTTFEFDWTYKVPPIGAPRTAFEDALGGRVFQVAQWYPQIAVYDDVVGQDVTPYTGVAEFYLEYGDFDFNLTLPAGWLVGATGTLQNPEQVLTPDVRSRLAQAMQTDSVVHVVAASDVGKGTVAGTGGKVTWRFQARNVRDVAFAASNKYLWDATRGTIPAAGGGTRNIPVYSFYRQGAPFWDRSARHGDHAIEFLSRVEIPYIYPQITVSEGPEYGMEYPMLVFVGRPTENEQALYEVIAHEVGHEWFPMQVGADEALAAWMDEGINTFQEALAFNDYFHTQEHWKDPREAYLRAAGQKTEAPMMRPADLLDNQQTGIAAYYKPGTVLRSLRAVVGDSVFHRAMRTYQNEWLLKHPYPNDFFNTFERVTGRDLDWFFYPWFFTTATLDQGITSVTQAAGTVTVTVRDLGQVPAPTFLVVTTAGGQTVRDTIPVETWLRAPGNTRVATATIRVPAAATRVEIDPEQIFPDVNRRNNVWTGQ